MLKRKLVPGDILMILINLLPIIGVWFLGWDAAQIFLVYAVETIIIGVVNVMKMAMVTIFVKPKDIWQNGESRTLTSGWFFIMFFIMHYGIFVLVQTQIFFGVSGIIKSDGIFDKYAQIPEALGEDGRLLLIIMTGYHILRAYFSFFRTGEYKKISLMILMFQPYVRIVVQQFIVILGSMFLTFGLGKIFIVIVVGVNIFFDRYLNLDRILEAAEKEKDKTKLPE